MRKRPMRLLRVCYLRALLLLARDEVLEELVARVDFSFSVPAIPAVYADSNGGSGRRAGGPARQKRAAGEDVRVDLLTPLP